MNNIVILIGRLIKKPELRKTTTGLSVSTFTLAINRNYKNSEGLYETDFINCKAYNHSAERLNNFCEKGDLIGIKGMIQTGSYEKDGKKIYTTDIVAERINFLSASKKEIKFEEKQENTFDKNIEEFSQEVDFSDLPF